MYQPENPDPLAVASVGTSLIEVTFVRLESNFVGGPDVVDHLSECPTDERGGGIPLHEDPPDSSQIPFAGACVLFGIADIERIVIVIQVGVRDDIDHRPAKGFLALSRTGAGPAVANPRSGLETSQSRVGLAGSVTSRAKYEEKPWLDTGVFTQSVQLLDMSLQAPPVRIPPMSTVRQLLAGP